MGWNFSLLLNFSSSKELNTVHIFLYKGKEAARSKQKYFTLLGLKKYSYQGLDHQFQSFCPFQVAELSQNKVE